MNQFQKSVRTAFASSFVADRIVNKADGTVEIKKGYFYRNGATPEGLARKAQTVLAAAGVSAAIVETRDDWKAPPPQPSSRPWLWADHGNPLATAPWLPSHRSRDTLALAVRGVYRPSTVKPTVATAGNQIQPRSHSLIIPDFLPEKRAFRTNNRA